VSRREHGDPQIEELNIGEAAEPEGRGTGKHGKTLTINNMHSPSTFFDSPMKYYGIQHSFAMNNTFMKLSHDCQNGENTALCLLIRS